MKSSEIGKLADGAIFLISNHKYSVLEACWAYCTTEDQFKAVHAEIMSRKYGTDNV